MIKSLKKFANQYPLLLELFLILIITIPSFSVLFNNQFFTMHDFQHVARLYLLDQGLKQGQVFPRWVDTLGFGFGYPLFNFYPPLIYYLAEIFHLSGLSLIASIKMVIFLGFFMGSYGTYLFTKKIADKKTALLASSLFTFFLYRGVLVYVRGALAEFFAMSLLPFIFLAFHNLYKKNNIQNAIYLGISLGLLVLSHSLIALPFVFFAASFFIFYFLQVSDKKLFAKLALTSALIGLSISAFFWLPSTMERKYTMVDQILTRELASYKIHYVEPAQFLYSPWGYGGSGPKLTDGMSFQIGKLHILLILFSVALYVIYVRHRSEKRLFFPFFLFLFLFSLFMSTDYSEVIWNNFKPLWYLQFPWRFLTFAGFFASIIGSYSIFMLRRILKNWRFEKILTGIIFFAFIQLTLFIYPKYFHPQMFVNSTDRELTSFDEIAWKISSTSFEFMPKGVKVTKSEYDTTIPDIKKSQISEDPFSIFPAAGYIKIRTEKNRFAEKSFTVSSSSSFDFRLNTFNFPGWTAYIDSKKTSIFDNNDYKLITIKVPRGIHRLNFIFENTPVRSAGNIISVISILTIAIYEIRRMLLSQLK